MRDAGLGTQGRLGLISSRVKIAFVEAEERSFIKTTTLQSSFPDDAPDNLPLTVIATHSRVTVCTQ